MKINSFTLLEKLPDGRWACLCDCGKYFTKFRKNMKRAKGCNRNCAIIKQRYKERTESWIKATHGSREAYAAHRAYLSYQRGAARRDKSFSLTPPQFNMLISGPCHYCNGQEAGGIDRVNNALGYQLDNCVSCCETCNRMKLEFSLPFFLDHVKKIAYNNP